MVYGGYGGFGGYGGYGGLGSTPTVASGIYPPGSAANDQYGPYAGTGQPQKPKSFLKGLFTGTTETLKKMFTTVPGVLATVGAVGLTVATGGAALIPLGALAAGYGVFNSAKGLADQDGQGFTKGLLLGLGGLLAMRFAPTKIAVGGRTFSLGGNDTAALGLTGRMKALWGGSKFQASNGDKLNVYSISTNKVMSQFRPNSASVQHLAKLKKEGTAAWKTPQDAKDAITAGAKVPDGTKTFLAKDKSKASRLKELNLKLEKQQLDGQPTETLEAEIARLSAKRAERFDEIKAGTYKAAPTPPAPVAAPSIPVATPTVSLPEQRSGLRRLWPFGSKKPAVQPVVTSTPELAAGVASTSTPSGAGAAALERHNPPVRPPETPIGTPPGSTRLSRSSSLSSMPEGEPVSPRTLSRQESGNGVSAQTGSPPSTADDLTAAPTAAAVTPAAAAAVPNVGAAESVTVQSGRVNVDSLAGWLPAAAAPAAAAPQSGQTPSQIVASEGWATDWEPILQNERSATANTSAQHQVVIEQPQVSRRNSLSELTPGRPSPPPPKGLAATQPALAGDVVVPQGRDNAPQLTRLSNNPDALLPPDQFESSAPVDLAERAAEPAQVKSPGWFKQVEQKLRSIFGSAEKLPRTEDPGSAFRFERSDQ